MSQDVGNVGAGGIFLAIAYLMMNMLAASGLTVYEACSRYGLTHGESTLCILIICIVLVWSFCQFGIAVIGFIIDIIVYCYRRLVETNFIKELIERSGKAFQAFINT